MRWQSQPPRAPEGQSWAKMLVSWLDKQERADHIVPSITEVVIDGTTKLLNTNVTCAHRLSLQTPSAVVPNCIWLICGWRHSGAGAGVGTAVSVGYIDGLVAPNSIQLRFFANTLTVNGANPLTVLLAFYPEPIPRIPQ